MGNLYLYFCSQEETIPDFNRSVVSADFFPGFSTLSGVDRELALALIDKDSFGCPTGRKKSSLATGQNMSLKSNY